MNRFLRPIIFATLLVHLLDAVASAQTQEEPQGFAVRELSLSSGYGSVQLPPITLGGSLPDGVLEGDLITSGSAALEWRRSTPRTRYLLDLFGTYTARTRYSTLNAPAGYLTFGVSRALGNRWRLGVGLVEIVANADHVASQPTQATRLIEDAASFDDLARTLAVVRSPSPNLAHAALFLPISESVAASDLYGTGSVISSAGAEATYIHSRRLATQFRGSYTDTREMSSDQDSRAVVPSPDATAHSAGVGVRYDRTERTQLTADVGWSEIRGGSVDQVISATLGYGWTGRKWFSQTTVGAALRPLPSAHAAAGSSPSSMRRPSILYSGALGYKFRTQTLLVQYSRAPHDEYGHGGRNVVSGFEGDVQSVIGAWSWWSQRSGWGVRSDVTMVRRPGNFSYIYAWLSTFGIGRQIGANVRLTGELLFDRHGSRMFEGFHMTREVARINVIWSPQRRQVERADSDHSNE
jgi:hypothetical protein